MKSCNAIVIGSGEGGVPLATNLGGSRLVGHKGEVGGSCINYGCTPTKTMISSARSAHYARVAPEFGILRAGSKSTQLRSWRKNEILESFRSGVQDQIDGSPNVRLYRGQGRFTGPHVVEVDGEALISDKIFINTVRGHVFLPFLVSIK